MEPTPPRSSTTGALLRVPTGEDSDGEQRSLGISTIDFKLTPQGSWGVLVLENSFHARSGPSRHLHYGPGRVVLHPGGRLHLRGWRRALYVAAR
jgi:hypothetical protein